MYWRDFIMDMSMPELLFVVRPDKHGKADAVGPRLGWPFPSARIKRPTRQVLDSGIPCNFE
jgi:hypothetical protein